MRLVSLLRPETSTTLHTNSMSIYNSKFAKSAGERVTGLLELTPARVPNQRAYTRSGKCPGKKESGEDSHSTDNLPDKHRPVGIPKINDSRARHIDAVELSFVKLSLRDIYKGPAPKKARPLLGRNSVEVLKINGKERQAGVHGKFQGKLPSWRLSWRLAAELITVTRQKRVFGLCWNTPPSRIFSYSYSYFQILLPCS